jgi:hypothetical protein
MFRKILYLNWKGSQYGLLPFLVAAFALPILAVQGTSFSPDRPVSVTVRASQILDVLGYWTPAFPAIAFMVGTVLALLVWNWDHKGEHVYSLTLPMARSRYVAYKMGAGAILLMIPVLLFWIGCHLSVAALDIPEGLKAYPNAIGFRFLLASLVAYALFFALAAGTMRTAIYLLTAWVVLLFLGELVPGWVGEMLHFQPLYEFSLLDWILRASVSWPGPFEVFTGNWMLIDV